MDPLKLYVVCYDIGNARRRYRVARACGGFGHRLQESVFQCWLTLRQVGQLTRNIERLVNASEDRVRIYPLCANDVPDARVAGLGQRAASPQRIVIL